MPHTQDSSTGWTVVGAESSRRAARLAREGDDDRRDADAPRTAWYVVRRTGRAFFYDGCLDAAAALTFYGLLAIFPAIVAVFSLLGVLGQDGAATETVVRIAEEVASEETAQALRGPLEQLASAPGAGIALVGGIAVAIWSASKYVGAFRRAMNIVYDVEEGRAFWKVRPLQLVVTLFAILVGAFGALAVTLSGGVLRAVGEAVGIGDGLLLAWNILKFPLLALLLVMLLAMLYATPNVKQPRFRWLSVGAIVTLVAIAISTAGFVLYIALYSGLEQTYGSLAAVLLFLFWLWSINMAALFGGELNAELERRRELLAGIAAEAEVQLPLRDGTQIVTRAKREQDDIDEGRRIRESRGER